MIPKRKVIRFNELREKAHEIAIATPQVIKAVEDFRGNVLILFNNRTCFIECYGLAEEELFKEKGSFWVIDSPNYKSFTFEKDLIKKFSKEEWEEYLDYISKKRKKKKWMKL